MVSGFVERGFFVKIPGSKAEGLVDFRHMDDQYVLEDGNLRVRGRRWGKIIKMGDAVKVRIVSVDLNRRQIEMEWAGE